MIVIVDSGLGNVRSIANMYLRLGIPAVVSAERSAIERAQRLILPGVGAFDHGMSRLKALDLVGALDERVRAGTPTLGICLGAQLMTRGSEEGELPGLGWIDADTVRFQRAAAERPIKIPHMGWSDVRVERATALFEPSEEPPRYYFVHSYHFACDHPEDVSATAEHGYRFPAAFTRGNLHGVQFHPEKSHRFGMALLKRFAEAG